MSSQERSARREIFYVYRRWAFMIISPHAVAAGPT